MISLEPKLLARYRDIALLLIRHGRSDLVKGTSLAEVLADEEGSEDSAEDSGPERLASDLEELGPTFVKLGQLLSTRPDLLPKPYLEALNRLQDDVGEFSFEEVEEIVAEELGVRISKAFDDFESKPLAAASLAQVHRARLRDGREVVVKVQRPGIREQVAIDLKALQEVAEMFDRRSDTARRYQVLQIVEEFRRALTRELDFRQEAANLSSFRQALSDFPAVRIPKPYPDYSSSKVLTMEYIEGTKIDEVHGVVHTDLRGESLAEELFRAYLFQVLVHGTFHADPHPGNVLLTRDREIGLLDLGMVGHVQAELQRHVLRLLLALSAGNGDEVADIALAIAEKREDCDEKTFCDRIAQLVAVHDKSKVAELEVGRLLMEVCGLAAEFGIYLPPTLSVLAKTLLNLDQIGIALDPEFDPQEAIRRYADELMRQRLKQDATPTNIFAALLETKEFVENLPSRANKILELVAENNMRVQVEVPGEHRLIASVEKVANRIAAGLVLAALIVGASMLMRVETRFTLFGYPGLAMMFFLLAAGLGFWLVFNILRQDQKASASRE